MFDKYVGLHLSGYHLCTYAHMTVPVGENPSCLHTTLASAVPQKSSHTVPHVLLMQTSTRPSLGVGPLTSLTSPVVQPNR